MAEGNAIPQFGNLVLDPGDDVIAGSYGTWRLTYEAGAAGLARGGRIRVHTDEPPDRFARLTKNVEYRCPVMNLFKSADVDVDVKWERVTS